MKLLIKRILARFPSPLPVGVSEFDKWSDSIIELSGKYADVDSLKFAIATMVMHADAKHGFLPKQYFITRLRKVAANQVASQIFQDIKTRQQEAAKIAQEAAEKEKLEATQIEAVSNGEKAQ